MRAWWLALLLFAATPALAVSPGPAPGTDPARRSQLHWIPEDDALLLTRICRPDGAGPFRLVVISHGRAPTAAGRAGIRPISCASEAARWFTARGFAVIAPVRRGYGETGGRDVEGARCTAARDYAATARIAARAIGAAIAYAATLPDLRRDRIVLVGQSAGGLATVAYASAPHPEVSAAINMAGGNGGHMHGRNNENCHPDLLARAAGAFGATSRLPELWVYAANDSYFAPAIATALHDAFVRAGGIADLIQPGPFGTDGHRLFLGKGGSAIWGPMVERYLQDSGGQGAAGDTAKAPGDPRP
jgi:dienelactone hydrolase